MVLEKIIKPEWVDSQPLYALPFGFAVAIIAISVSIFIFPDDASIAGILFATVASVAFLSQILDIEERGTNFWKRSEKMAIIYALFFVGVAAAYALWFKVVPAGLQDFFFSKQLAALGRPSASWLGNFIGSPQFLGILANNLKVMAITLILSLIYGAGALIVITWNASVLGVFVAGFDKFRNFFAYVPHTALEFLGFFFGAMAGGLISIAIDEESAGSQRFDQTLMDAVKFFLIAIGLIVLAAFIETSVLY